MENTGRLYFGGMSTDIEIKALKEKFPAIKPGDLLSHDEICAVIGCSPAENRYQAVMQRFKKVIFSERNLEIVSRRGEGYAVLTAGERVRRGSEDVSKIHSKMRKVHFRMAAVPRNELTREDAKTADHSQMLLAKLCDDLAQAKKEIAPPGVQWRLEAVARPE